MYKILKDGEVLSVTGKPVWVKSQENGSFALSTEPAAHGVVVNGEVFHLSGRPEIEGKESVVIAEVDDGLYANGLTVLVTDPLDLKTVEQFRKVVQLFAGSLGEDTAMEVATIYPAYQVGRAYAAGEYFTSGTNNVGDPPLSTVVQAHTSQADWKPDSTAALYTPIGLTKEGYAEWSQPTGAHDAYNKGDIVSCNGKLYQSKIDGNIWSPEAYPDGWETYIE